MTSILRKHEILAYIEIKRTEGTLQITDFLNDLPDELKERINALILSTDEREDLLSQMDSLVYSKSPVFMVLEDETFPSRFIASTLEEVLEESGADLLLTSKNPLGFDVHLIHESDCSWISELMKKKKPYTLSILGLGDVGGTLLMGLRLLGRDILKEIRIFDLDEKKRRRYYLEINEISDGSDLPPVVEAGIDEIFDTDVLVFTVSIFIPPVGTSLTDVRLVQFEKNRRVLLDYAKKAEESGFKGYYFIVSDPVDLLCMNLMDEGGIASHRIRGFGLGVMEARARFIAKERGIFHEDLRTFGPHGKGLIVINSLKNYDVEISEDLTALTERENFRVRETGFKPYIAPALSSGSISILKALNEEEHLSTFYNGRVFMGARNTLIESFTLPDKVDLPQLRTLLTGTEDLLMRLYEGREKK
ncbi:lactate/malate family dehydrogenase [Proteiniclasticum sp.]|uniref:lactate/malate family dehydrogenase n=1 Tax=Proteiniclasticum sp. TaxID=2053595 RepID=UPI00289E82CE|nr:hypothetical protein [Proteiniclasticum sp.]